MDFECAQFFVQDVTSTCTVWQPNASPLYVFGGKFEIQNLPSFGFIDLHLLCIQSFRNGYNLLLLYLNCIFYFCYV